MLDEIQAGVFDGMTYAQIEQTMPEEFAARKADKLGYRLAMMAMHLQSVRSISTQLSACCCTASGHLAVVDVMRH